MKRRMVMALIAFLLLVCSSVVYADNSRVVGNVSAIVSGSLIHNIASGFNTEAMTSSVFLESSELYGDFNSTVEASLTILNLAVGVNASADLGSVVLKNAVVRGDINVSIRGMSITNMAVGNRTRSGLGSVIAR